jgi:methanogen homoisocitrate dehydrogenase
LELGYSNVEESRYRNVNENFDTLKGYKVIFIGVIHTLLEVNYKNVLRTNLKKRNLLFNIRSVDPFPGVIGITGISDFNFIIVRKNTEGLY